MKSSERNRDRVRLLCAALACAALAAGALCQAQGDVREQAAARRAESARTRQAEGFLAQRGGAAAAAQWRGEASAQARAQGLTMQAGGLAQSSILAAPQGSGATAAWEAAGPAGISSAQFGMLSGRVTALAYDSHDATGNKLYVGTTGGGVWAAQNARDANAVFQHLTDRVGALDGVRAASISIGALTVQPGGTGVVLAGTGDPNDALDSYYGVGILRSTDGGATWSLIQMTSDLLWMFAGEGFAGFAWSTQNPSLVVAAVSQSYEGALVEATQSGSSYKGLYYSTDSGASWRMATITDGAGKVVQGPQNTTASPEGNAATAVVWNPVRKVFLAAVRRHGYYQSADGVTWTRLSAQPGDNLTTAQCPYGVASAGCPIFRGALAVNPSTGDAFAWTVDGYNQDQGLWQDPCAKSLNTCANGIGFSKRWSTASLERNTSLGAATIVGGDYNLTLAAVPAVQVDGADTVLFAGAADLWKCSLAGTGCAWRNLTNSSAGACAKVAAYQHAIAWDATNWNSALTNATQTLFFGNDGGLWRTQDQAYVDAGAACSASDASHFDNLNGAFYDYVDASNSGNNRTGSLAEAGSLATPPANPYTLLAGFGASGSAGLKSSAAATGGWTQVLSGEGGPVAIDPASGAWYVNASAGVSIYRCLQPGPCTASDFGATPVVGQSQVAGDGLVMSDPAAFVLDPVDAGKALVGTCRLWRGAADGSAWTAAANAISPIFSTGISTGSCTGEALIRSIAAIKLPGGGERIYVGMRGAGDGGASLAGHLFTAEFDSTGAILLPAGSMSGWTDLSLSSHSVGNDTSYRFNSEGLDVSSITIDAHDVSGKTIYATIAGLPSTSNVIRTLYRSTDGGASWLSIASNLPWSPANSVVVDPLDPNTVYVALDIGVYSTRSVASCSGVSSSCWSAYGTGLPMAPVMVLSASSSCASPLLTAATYGRGLWRTSLWTASSCATTASLSASSLSFSSYAVGATSPVQTVTVRNTGSAAMLLTSLAASCASTPVSGDCDFDVLHDGCTNVSVAAGSSCSFDVAFTPALSGSRTGSVTLSGNLASTLVVALSGTGTPAAAITVSPSSLNFGCVLSGTSTVKACPTASITGSDLVCTSSASSAPVDACSVTLQNTGAAATYTLAVSGDFALSKLSQSADPCGGKIAASASCAILLSFTPSASGAATGALTITDAAGVQSVNLKGWGSAPATDTLSALSLSFPDTIKGVTSPELSVALTNSGDAPLESISIAASAGYHANSACTTQLAARSSCTIGVTFTPTQVGDQPGVLTIQDIVQSQAGTQNRTQTVALSGRGLAPPVLSVAPSSLSFADTEAGQKSAAQTLTVSNTGNAAASSIGFQIAEVADSNFTVGSTSCGATLAAGASCTVQAYFAPLVSGGQAATLAVSSATLGVEAVTAQLAGTGITHTGISVAPPAISFGVAGQGMTSAAQSVTISNLGSVAASTLTLAASAPFSLSQNNCPSSLSAGASCTASLVFSPTALGEAVGALRVTSKTVSPSAMVLLRGSGVASSGLALSVSSLDFGTLGVGQTSSASTVTLTNTGAYASLSGIALSATSDFKIASSTCSSTLSALASCTFTVVFTPGAVGAEGGVLTASGSAGSVTATLYGVGFDFAMSASGSTSQSVISGNTASYTFSLAPSGGLSASFALQCGTLPSYASCAFTPNPASSNAGASSTVVLKVATASSASAQQTGGAPLWPQALPWLCGLLMLPLARRRGRRSLLLAILALGSLGALTNCGGAGGGISGGPSTGSGKTPAGSYSITATATASGLSRSVTFTLTVQ